MSDGLWMKCSVKFSTGAILRQNDPVELFHTKFDRGRFRQVEIDSEFVTLRQYAARAGDDPQKKPVIIIHCGRLHVVERQCLTDVAPPPRPPIATVKATRQKALFE